MYHLASAAEGVILDIALRFSAISFGRCSCDPPEQIQDSVTPTCTNAKVARPGREIGMSDEKTEEPTEQKLEKAREQGNFPKSQELASAVVFGVVLMTCVFGSSYFIDRFRVLIRLGLDFDASRFTDEALLVKAGIVYESAFWLIVPIALVSAVAGMVGMLCQIGFHISFKPIEPKFENLNPINGVKKIFSIKSLLELGQMIVRGAIIGAVGWWLIKSAIRLFAGAAYQPLPLIGETAWHLITRLLEVASVCFIVMAGIDYGIQRWHYIKGQRMSKDEIKREYKESEGDPLIKSVRTQIARENAQSGPAPQLSHAKVILTNPTHYAVAIAYEPGRYNVPVIVARGADSDAQKIRDQAQVLGIPIFSNPPLARALYKLPLSGAVPRQYFEVIAAILIWLQRVEAANSGLAAFGKSSENVV